MHARDRQERRQREEQKTPKQADAECKKATKKAQLKPISSMARYGTKSSIKKAEVRLKKGKR
ncbi:hypothetical protein [Thermoanaerobacterium sp. RBIITD]|uniref:hypothetical protein n=1 Tax=Thermoanaerobacterium sp. RBIITD TaxID=1550240 RepID=UPI000BB98EC0|nr:hypothetical protein [Thermoanaerobacterium sp. RBIITD]